MPNVEQKTPDDGQRICPKHVGFYDEINLDNQCVWLVIKKKKDDGTVARGAKGRREKCVHNVLSRNTEEKKVLYQKNLRHTRDDQIEIGIK